MTPAEIKLDSLHIPVTAIEAIYMPIASPEEIGVVGSQLVYYNIEAQILGSGDWYDLAELEANKRYADGVIFSSDTFVHPEDSTYQNFLARVLDRMNVRATRTVLSSESGFST